MASIRFVFTKCPIQHAVEEDQIIVAMPHFTTVLQDTYQGVTHSAVNISGSVQDNVLNSEQLLTACVYTYHDHRLWLDAMQG